ncbi:hypothetical protein DFQ01_1606 [Paenibacillus cellulosilyticus]|uniref:Uncharacterized protein n=1 Tax=Paenibacillus cellulosilyticus TaxID=375489 RepID=A0A2V2YAF2_9BACL|nr:hypothetical protein [Paenibacillus cellulosilyticus]PWV87632.1 hypothetical protein DFQ01_1606 [Paenibacillus cellulosilyticus]QKS44955.1 hypothetical protein HUB94_11435 [Paenibacillus cellulosilyticus]
MSKYSFIVSNSTLPEIDLTDAKRMKYGEYKKLYKESRGSRGSSSILDQLDDKDDELVILIMNPIKMHHLKITICTNPPSGIEEYIQKDFIYWLEGDSDDGIWKEQLYEYLLGLNNYKNGLEIWSIWFGDGLQDIEEIQLKLSELKISDLEALQGVRMNYCIKIE